MIESVLMERRIGEIFGRKLNLPVLAADIDLFESGILDSHTFVELLSQLEQEYGFTVRLQELEFEDFRSIGRIAAFVRRRLAAVAPARPVTGFARAGVECPA